VAVSNVELRVDAKQAITALRSVDVQANKFNKTVNGTQSKLRDANKGLSVLPKGFFATGNAAKGAAVGVGVLGAAMQSALLPLLGITTAVAAFTKAFQVLQAQDFASAKVKTLGVDVDTLKPKLKSLSNELSGQASSLDLLSASYDVASAGFGEVAELTDVLTASQLGATGGFSDLGTVADATTSVLNAYGLESEKAAKIVDGFVQTQNDGKIIVEQYAQQIGRLAPVAAGAGVGIDELNAAISSVTATGVPVESTFAGLRMVIASIQKPSAEASKAAEKLGVDFSATALKTKGLGGVLSELIEKGGASEEMLAKFFRSVEARTAVLPLLNDELVSFNKNLENQANAQDVAAKAAFTASNTIQGQLTRLGSAFTNLTAEGSEFGILIRESLKIAAVTVEALGSAFELVMIPVRFVSAAVGEVGKAIAEAMGVDATNTLFELEQGWIMVKEGVTQFSNAVINVGKTVGTIVGTIIKAVIGAFKKINDFINSNPVLKFIFGVAKLPTLKVNVDTNLEAVNQLKEGVESTAIASNNIVKSNLKNKQVITETTDKINQQKEAADKLKDKFMEIGQDIEQGIVSNLTDAVMGTKTLAQSAISVLNQLKRKLIEVAIQQAVSGIGKKIGGFLGSVFGGGKAAGGSVKAGKTYLVGEKGPELLSMGAQSGFITPNNKLSGGGTSNIVNVSVDASGSAVSGNNADAQQLGALIGAAVQNELIKETQPGGLLAR
jgi:TP901 family phage tail tape measure protein